MSVPGVIIVGVFFFQRYNMPGVTLTKDCNEYILEVPGLAEKRPSLLRGKFIGHFFVYLERNQKSLTIL